MRHPSVLMLIALCACASPGGYSGAACLTAGDLSLKGLAPTLEQGLAPTLEQCAENIRIATRLPDASHLGQLIQRQGISAKADRSGACTGDGRVYLVTPAGIRPDTGEPDRTLEHQ